METSLLHESVKQNIFNIEKIKNMSVTVKRDLEEHRLSLGRGDDGGIPESIVPSRTSYCEEAASSLKEEEVKAEQSESANAESMEVDTSGDANDGANPASDDEVGEAADAQVSEAERAKQVEQRINMVMGPVSKVYRPDSSMLIVKDDVHFVLPPWAVDRNTAKCAFCDERRQVDLPWVEDSKPACSRCGQPMLIAEDVAAEMSDTTWASIDGDLIEEVISGNREAHVLDSDRAAAEPEKKVPAKNQKTEPVLNKVFGHDQNAIEGFGICEEGLQKSLNEEKSERDAETEFEGAVKTKREDDAQKGNVDCEEHPPLGGQEADDEGEDLPILTTLRKRARILSKRRRCCSIRSK